MEGRWPQQISLSLVEFVCLPHTLNLPKLICKMAHITTEQKYTISVMLVKEYSQQSISTAINKDNSVVGREISRNCNQKTEEYNHELTPRKYRKRMKKS